MIRVEITVADRHRVPAGSPLSFDATAGPARGADRPGPGSSGDRGATRGYVPGAHGRGSGPPPKSSRRPAPMCSIPSATVSSTSTPGCMALLAAPRVSTGILSPCPVISFKGWRGPLPRRASGQSLLEQARLPPAPGSQHPAGNHLQMPADLSRAPVGEGPDDPAAPASTTGTGAARTSGATAGPVPATAARAATAAPDAAAVAAAQTMAGAADAATGTPAAAAAAAAAPTGTRAGAGSVPAA